MYVVNITLNKSAIIGALGKKVKFAVGSGAKNTPVHRIKYLLEFPIKQVQPWRLHRHHPAVFRAVHGDTRLWRFLLKKKKR